MLKCTAAVHIEPLNKCTTEFWPRIAHCKLTEGIKVGHRLVRAEVNDKKSISEPHEYTRILGFSN